MDAHGEFPEEALYQEPPLTIRTTTVLRKPAFRVIPEMCSTYRKLAYDMLGLMHEAGGVGLAAPQVGFAVALTVINVGGDDPLILINPEFIFRKGKRRLREGCLSLPGQWFDVQRHTRVGVKYLDLDGVERIVQARNNTLAQALEHEVEHLSGMLIDQKVALDIAKSMVVHGRARV